MRRKIDVFDVIWLGWILLLVILCPFTKVEESFNMQAIHDLLTYKLNFDKYDHFQFPGVVPRTFIGSIIVASIAYPFDLIIQSLQLAGVYRQYLVRAIVGFLSWYSFLTFREGINKRFSRRAGQIATILMTCQFHLPFYMSRTLPNTFALMGGFMAMGHWLKGHPLRCLLILTATLVIFRCDLLVLLAPLTLQMLINKEVELIEVLGYGVSIGFVALALTVSVDSIMWREILWPEGIVLFFNTVENRSSEWGTQPFGWYFLNAIPKATTLALVWAILALAGLQHPLLHMKEAFPTFPDQNGNEISPKASKIEFRHDSDKENKDNDSSEDYVRDNNDPNQLDDEGEHHHPHHHHHHHRRHHHHKHNHNNNDDDSKGKNTMISTAADHHHDASPKDVDDLYLHRIHHHRTVVHHRHRQDDVLQTKVSSLGLMLWSLGGKYRTVLGYYLLPTFCFLFFYSFLPHKELRFVFLALPMLSMAAGIAWDQLLRPDSENTQLSMFLGGYLCEGKINHFGTKDKSKNKPASLGHSQSPNNPNERYRAKYFSGSHYFRVKMSNYTSQRVFFLEVISSFVMLFTLIGMAVLTSFYVKAAIPNYAGGIALRQFQQELLPSTLVSPMFSSSSSSSSVSVVSGLHQDAFNKTSRQQGFFWTNVHIDVVPAMTGVTRFLQESEILVPHSFCPMSLSSPSSSCSYQDLITSTIEIRYSKTEKLQSFDYFDFLITDDANKHSNTFEVLSTIDGYDHLDSSNRIFWKIPWPRVVLAPKIYILRKRLQ